MHTSVRNGWRPLYLRKLRSEWPWVKSFGVIISERLGKEGVKREERYFITSLKMDAGLFLKTERDPWRVENGLH